MAHQNPIDVATGQLRAKNQRYRNGDNPQIQPPNLGNTETKPEVSQRKNEQQPGKTTTSSFL
jgi:hypothetical protein